jgi:hypothetical protein
MLSNHIAKTCSIEGVAASYYQALRVRRRDSAITPEEEQRL